MHDMVIWGCNSEEPLWLSLAAIAPCMSPSHLETGPDKNRLNSDMVWVVCYFASSST